MPGVALYRHFAADGSLLYVGISVRPLTRLGEHEESRWIDKVSRVDMERFPTRDAAIDAERNAIVSERPIYNIVHNRPKSERPRHHISNEKTMTMREVREACGVNPIYSKGFPAPINQGEYGKWIWRASDVTKWLERKYEKRRGRWKPVIEPGDMWVTSTEILSMVNYRASTARSTLPVSSAKSINYGRGGSFIMKGRDLWRLSQVLDFVNRHRKTSLSMEEAISILA